MRLDVLVTAAFFTVLGSLPLSADSFDLAPGEVVVAIDGQAVSTATPSTTCVNGVCSLKPAVVGQPIRNVIRAHHNAKVIRRNEAAYQWCLREAQKCAANGYSQGHPSGACPYGSCTGTGYSWSPDRPNHCCQERGEHNCIARACYHCPRTGRYYWASVYN